MKNILLLLPALIISAVSPSCTNNSTQEPAEHEITKPETSGDHCYSYTSNKDTVLMKLSVSGNAINGELRYQYFEKDQNTGTLEGIMNGDTLFATYTFMSEGMESKRELAFIKKGMDLVEGYGEVEEKNGGFVFKNHNSINFDNKMVLQHGECEK